jgi:hypothetical protein
MDDRGSLADSIIGGDVGRGGRDVLVEVLGSTTEVEDPQLLGVQLPETMST